MARTTTPTAPASSYAPSSGSSKPATSYTPSRTSTPSTPKPTTPSTPSRPTTPSTPSRPTTPSTPPKDDKPSGNGGGNTGNSGNASNGGSGEEKQELIKEITIGPIKAPTFPGSPGPGIFGLMLSLSDIEEMIPKLRQASTDLKDTWSKTLNSSIAKIEHSWAGEDAKVYTDKVQALDPQVDKICQAIDLLAQTYQKVLDRSRSTVSEISQKISSININ